MNSKTRIALSTAACCAVCAFALADAPAGPAQYSAPPADNPVAGPAPSQAYVWMSGHWDSEGGQWRWQAAHWELPPSRSATWAPGHWISSGGNWVWVNGAWNISDAQQSLAGPPQPPGQAIPAPSTPAPYVYGQYQGGYGPGGVVRAIDQPPVTTDYGPVEYSEPSYPDYGYPGYAYAGYAWAGDPLYWGFPGVALGLGWGPGYFGWGRGGFGRGYSGHGFAHGGYARGGFARGGFAHGVGSGHFGR